MESIASTATENALKCSIEVVKRQVGYLLNYKDKVQELNKNVTDLENAKVDVENLVKAAERNAEEIKADVPPWVEEVDNEVKEYKNFLGDGGHAKTGCSIGLFPKNLLLRYRLGRKATKMAEKRNVNELVSRKFESVSYLPAPSTDAAFLNTGYESFASRKETVEKIMKALEDSTVRMVGVYGAGGVGKTTLVKEVAQEAQENKLFNVVVMATITRNPDLKKIQGQVAEMLGMRLEEESEIVRAGRLQKRLNTEKGNTLIILDDLWAGLDLNMLGIPWDDDDNDDRDNDGRQKVVNNVHMMKKVKSFVDYKGCKILLTSRREEVLCKEMNVNKNSAFPVGILNEMDSETLLKKVADIKGKNSQFENKATEIAKICAGLPIAIVSIGKALKGKSPFVWKDVCQQLEQHNFTEGRESIEFCTKLSYDYLKNEELKSIFLLSARMGNDSLIMDLVKFCIGLGILQGVCTIREARGRVNAMIEELKADSSLLVESYSKDRFNMHDIVRDVALSIASKEKHVFTMKNGKLDEWPNEDKLKRYTVISLHYCDVIDELPESIYCPRLEVFHVDSNDPFLKIPDNFFKGMRKLKVLILTGFHLSCLPSSIKYLTNLRMLCLERCTLRENLSIIGELKKLRILTLSRSNIESLPVELGQLDKLQLFDLSNCSKLRVIPSKIISRMSSLEELYMRDNLIQWEAEQQRNQSENASLSELRHLNQLTTLEMHIPNAAHLPRNLFFDKLDSYKIVIGEFNMLSVGDFNMHDKYEASKVLALQLKDGCDIHSEKGIKMLFKKVENLLLGVLNGVHDVSPELNFEGFPNLRHLSIVNNFSIRYIISSLEQSHPLKAFPILESMCLCKLQNFEKICDNQLADASFSQLKIVKIKLCGQLESLFSVCMVRLLTKLETIEVCDCDSLKGIISIERQVNADNDVIDDQIKFPQLRFLKLQSLPKLSCFYTSSKSYIDEVPNKELTEISREVEQGANACSSLFNKKVSIPKLESLELSSIDIQIIWNDQSFLNHYFENLLTLKVTDCGNLTYLLSFSMAGCLEKLESLFVSGCQMMKDIFLTEDTKIDVFPKLKKMEISCMEKLNTIWHPHIGLHSFESLDSLIIKDCHDLVTIIPAYMWQRFRSLQSLDVADCKLVKTIFDLRDTPQTDVRIETNLHNVSLEELPNLVHVWTDDTEGILNFNNLQNVYVSDCGNLESLFPLYVAIGLEKLKFLGLFSCLGMKEIVARDERSSENTITFKFPQLTSVSFQFLPQLRSFCGGTHTLEWPSLKGVLIFSCEKLEAFTAETTDSQEKPIFSAAEKVISNLEYMAMGLKEAQWLQHYIGNIHRLHQLKSLVMDKLKNTEILFWLLHRIPNLESLRFINCQFKEAWDPGSMAAHDKIGTVVQLKELIFQNSLILQKIGFEHDLLLQRVERLVIEKCPALINLAPSSVSFSHLTYLEVKICNKLRNLMSSSTAKSLVQLTTMKVTQCKMMTGIVAKNINEEEKAEEIEFRQLKTLELVSLQSLTSFCSSTDCNFKFPLLEKLLVSECPRMEIFCRGVKSTPQLQKLCIEEGEEESRWCWEGDLNATIQKIFINKVSFEYSKHLRLYDHPELNQVWHGKGSLPANCFRSLKALVVENCDQFLKDFAIPSNVLSCLKNLEELKVRSCSAVEAIFDINDTEIRKTRAIAFRLKKLTLDQLPNLKSVWKQNPQGIVSFPNLQEVAVSNCGSLKTLLPASVARNLGKLKILDIRRCDVLEEIVGEEDAVDKAVFEFPCLTSLVLCKLPQLSCFYPGRHHLECPNLKVVDVSLCGTLKIFTSDFQRHQESLPEGQISAPTNRIQQSLFLAEKVIPNLKELTLNEENMIMLSDGYFPPGLLYELNRLELCFEDASERVILPFEFLQKVPNLELLRLGYCAGLEEIFPSQKLEVHNGMFERLKELDLQELHELDSIGLEHSWVKPLCEKLVTLWIYRCSSLKKLVHCAVSFCNLKDLYVTGCNGLKHLFTFSTAKCLVQLEGMYVKECESIEEIVTNGDESASDEIIFGRLRYLTLESLPSLVSFYSGNSTLQFSSLQSPLVIQCPQMKTFSRGVINAPMLFVVQASLEESFHFHDDLNTTMEMLFKEKVAESACEIQHLKFGDHPGLEEMWLGVVPIPTKRCFNNLKSLIVVKCESLSNVLPFNLLRYLRNLEEIEVSDCEPVKAIFDMEDVRVDRQMLNTEPAPLLSLPLKKLTLTHLPNLEHIWNMNPDGIVTLQDLQEVQVDGCQGLKSLFHTSVPDHLVKLDVKNCERLMEIVAEEEAAMEGRTKQFLFHCLTSLTLWELPELKCFYPGKHSLEWPMLKELEVYHCHKLKLFTTEHQSCGDAHVEGQRGSLSIDEQAIISVEKVFPNLEKLLLRKEDIVMIWQGQFQANLDTVKFLSLYCFDDETDLFPYGFLQKVPNIEKLGVGCSSFKEIFSSEISDVDYVGVLSKLKGLYLYSLSELSSIGLEHSWVEPFFESLQILDVKKCHGLMKLAPSTVSFSNLTDLTVDECDGLLYLFTSSTVKSLGLLKQMSMRECKSIQEIVAKEGNGESDDDEMTFGQLKTLNLHSLPSLVGFYSGSCNLKFPSLDKVRLMACPQMEYFCKGVVSTPNLRGIESDIKWKGDLNATIRKALQAAAIRNSQAS